MILTEQHIELNIYHQQQFQRFTVIQIWKEDFDIDFKVSCNNRYVFTLVIENQARGFQLSKLDRELEVEIDWSLYSKIAAAIYSVFLRNDPS